MSDREFVRDIGCGILAILVSLTIVIGVAMWAFV
jgi:hypothetical protein